MSPSSQPLVTHLTNQMKGYTQSLAQPGGANEFQLTEAAYNNLINIINEHQSEITKAYNHAATLTNYGSVGGCVSANNTASNLADVCGSKGGVALDAIGKYNDYLDQFKNAVNAACSQMLAEDQSGLGPVSLAEQLITGK
jgi:hypothetical protein